MIISNIDDYAIVFDYENNTIIIYSNDIEIIGDMKKAILSFIDTIDDFIVENESMEINFYGINFITITKEKGLEFNEQSNPTNTAIEFREEFNRILKTSLVLR